MHGANTSQTHNPVITTMKEFTLTKQISKQGGNYLLVIPKFLHGEIKPRDVVEVRIRVLKSGEEG